VSPTDRITVFDRPGRFAGWPANYGMWAWGQEVLAIFVVGRLGHDGSIHARDTSRPFVPVQARSHDGGLTWSCERFPGLIPGGAESLNADEHVEPRLRVGPRLGKAGVGGPGTAGTKGGTRADAGGGAADAEPEDGAGTDAGFVPLEVPLTFDDPETIVLCGRTDITRGSVSWFHASTDRGRTWRGPYLLPMFGQTGVSARTDVVPLGGHSALFLLTGSKPDGNEGRSFAVRTDDGGRSFRLVSYLDPAPAGWAIMPSSVRLPDGTILTALRRQDPAPVGPGDPLSSGDPVPVGTVPVGPGMVHTIEVRRSADDGVTWEHVATPVADTGGHGNPPALVRTAAGVLALHYGFRDDPRGLRAVISRDDGATWSEPIVLTDDTATHDMGYPRAVALDDGTVLVVYYSNTSADSERTIEAVRWRPGNEGRRQGT
jgi:hypothetical protein